MKKLFILLGMVMGLSAYGQDHLTIPLLNVRSLYISNSVTWVTNLLSAANPTGTNLATVIVTNKQGIRLTTSTGSTNVTSQKILERANLQQKGMITSLGATNQSIFVRVGNAGANATNAFSLAFRAVPNGTNEVTGTEYVVTSTLATAVSGNWLFPLPTTPAFIGCKSVQLTKVYCVAPVEVAGDFWIHEISLVGFRE